MSRKFTLVLQLFAQWKVEGENYDGSGVTI
jgi:hypothetical protein